ncbi:MAG: radical SAM protein [Deltaproteobacteria bacterium]|nr:radical SAM protein [Deltaproteobacteria bacterium]
MPTPLTKPDPPCLALTPDCSLKHLEQPYIYDKGADELYEVNDEAFEFLKKCDGTRADLDKSADPEFLTYCLDNGLLEFVSSSRPRIFPAEPAPRPSWRYLELQLTSRCNLACRHCYLGPAGREDLTLPVVLDILHEFEEMQGLRVLLSGGEPLLWPYLSELNAQLDRFDLRFVLLTNGTLLDEDILGRLKVQEIQFSLDGLAPGHEALRGAGTFAKTVKAMELAKSLGYQLSVATMIHACNLSELNELGTFLEKFDLVEWGLDIPCVTGALASHRELPVPYAEGAEFLSLAYGGGYHGTGAGHTCGFHLAAVLPSGQVARCGFYGTDPLGHAAEGLRTCWSRRRHLAAAELDCHACAHLEECGGGCRFRAGSATGPDPVMCAVYGVDSTMPMIKEGV